MSKLTDPRLLELAAKAIEDITLTDCSWNPLEYRSDALLLACRVGVQMVPYPETKPPMAVAMLPNNASMKYFSEVVLNQTMEQAMCRAITRAAAHYQLLKEENHASQMPD